MNSFRIVAVLLVSFALVSGLVAADRYVVDKDHTNVGFSVTHMVITKVHGEFKDFDVQFIFDENDLQNSAINASIKTASIDTDNEKRDKHLRSPDFLNAKEYPEITFSSEDIQKRGEQYVANGILTIRGVSNSVELPFRILGKVVDPYGNTRIGAEGSLTINRHDFGVSWNKTLDNGGLVVGDEVTINLDVEMIKKE